MFFSNSGDIIQHMKETDQKLRFKDLVETSRNNLSDLFNSIQTEHETTGETTFHLKTTRSKKTTQAIAYFDADSTPGVQRLFYWPWINLQQVDEMILVASKDFRSDEDEEVILNTSVNETYFVKPEQRNFDSNSQVVDFLYDLFEGDKKPQTRPAAIIEAGKFVGKVDVTSITPLDE